ncbi:hypothetical protein AAD018_003780 [Aestuariibius insulae]|uniref:hypothetical protein n=1 Tax=Aestuariibius insulae TaxID=2058287 RepID=UPI00345EF739
MKIPFIIGGAALFSVAAAASLATIHSLSEDLEQTERTPIHVPQLYGKAPMEADLSVDPVNGEADPMIGGQISPARLSSPEGVDADASNDWSEIHREASIKQETLADEQLSILPSGNNFATQPRIAVTPPVTRQRTQPRPVETLIPDDRPADDRTVKQTWSVGVYR